jgi:hypothetical protein
MLQTDERDIIKAWLEDFVWQITQANHIDEIDPNNFLVWDSLTPYQQGYAFHYLLGVFADTVGTARENDEDLRDE